ncbi:MAG TPA: UDP-N-acetylmuramate dehydrogenase [Candidatus Acidoferrales bacterium]|jgi:UDP-N-acetylenolpyruvoylglucosamine reductase|nr:UDP-N-acetylmuramate dehydrogenase [Candidatus Acidoferrales bacterium]
MTAFEPSSMVDELAGRLSPGTVIKRDEPMAKHTTLRVGGPADAYVEPVTEGDLAAILKFCNERGVKFFLLGRGSNLVVRDNGFRGVVICLAHANFSKVEIDGLRIRAGAGAKQKAVAVEAKRNGLTGVEFLEGIPGSIGGALRMNAGAMGGETFNAVELVRVMDFAGDIRELRPAEMSVTYRCCATLKDHIALSAVFKCVAQPRAEIEQRMKAYSEKRWSSQPAAPSAGCMFKNPAGIPAGKLIQELGLKGTFVGGAMVSLEHGNFLVNGGMATAADVLELIATLQAKARAERGIELHTEVEVIGE